MKYTPIYIKSLELNNVRRFQNATINFVREDGTLPQWTLILGDNGIGKTTLLQGIGWLKPNVHDAKDPNGETIDKDKIEPVINVESNESLEQLVNNNGFFKAQLRANFIADVSLGNAIPKKTKECFSQFTIEINKKRKLEDIGKKFDTNAENIFFDREVLIIPYNASRRLGKSNIYDPELQDPFILFNDDDSKLFDIEEVLHTVNYASLGNDEDSGKHKEYKKVILETLKNMLPTHDNVERIEIAVPKLVNGVLRPGNIDIVYKDRNRVPYSNVSLGYKSVLALTTDIAWRLFSAYPESQTPLNEAAIVLLDEIDLHLHPLWQREIIHKLSQSFPNVQFIATAHSPLIVQAALDANYEIVKEDNNLIVVISDTENIDGWRIDQILTSDFFGLRTSRGPEVEDDINERRSLLDKKRLTKEDKVRLDELDQKLSALPVLDSDNQKLLDRIQRMANLISEKGGVND
ncbi:AAA family ATPase [Flavobacterium alkalisoli]|uniref:AAA family ATPase n=1 Tax=Flavobacterium alkalisoli TaxID=2602769 RepID=UPI003A90E917